MSTSHGLAGLVGLRAAALALAGLSAMLIAPKCGMDVTVPAEDRTPPAAELVFVGPGNKTETVPARGLQRTVAEGGQVAIVIEGNDPDGLMRARITSSSITVCAAGAMTEERREDVVHTETNQVKPGEVGNTRLVTSLVIDGKFRCASGLAPKERRITVFGTAENYHGGITTTPTLVLDVLPAASPTPPR